MRIADLWRRMIQPVATMSFIEALAYIGIYLLGGFLTMAAYGMSTDDCHGAGAAHPGGCREFSDAIQPRFERLCAIQPLLLIVMLVFFSKVRVRGVYRLLFFIAYAMFLWISPEIPYMSPLLPK